jgi:hypothetical protein
MLETGNKRVDFFLRALQLSKEEELSRGKAEALQHAENDVVMTKPLVLAMIAALSTEVDEATAAERCSLALVKSCWTMPRVVAEVVGALALTLSPRNPSFLDRLYCNLDDGKKTRTLTYHYTAGVLAGVMLSVGSPVNGWASYPRYGRGEVRPRSHDENLVAALISTLATWPDGALSNPVPPKALIEETERLLDQAVLAYVSPGKKSVGTDPRARYYEDVPQPPERLTAIATVWKNLGEHAATKKLNPVGRIFMDKLSHRLLGLIPVEERGRLTALASPPEKGDL